MTSSRYICGELEEKSNIIWNMAFTNYVSPSRYEKYESYTCFEGFTTGGKEKQIQRIQDLLSHQYDVRGGWMATDIKGYHNYYIIYKHKN